MKRESWLFGIDPGVKACGVALFVDGELLSVEHTNTLPSNAALASLVKADIHVVVEKPQVYRTLKGDPNDLVDVAVAGGEMLGRILQAVDAKDAVVERIVPAVWKKQLPKTVVRDRVERLLSAEEQKVLMRCRLAPSLMHNVVDAVGIGLWGLKRFRP